MSSIRTGGSSAVSTYFTQKEGFVVALPIRLGMIISGIGIFLYAKGFYWMDALFGLDIPTPVRILAIFSTLLAILLMHWTLKTLGKNYSMSLHIKANQTLIDHGPYSFVRHPMYTCLLLFFLSITLVSADIIVGIGGLLSTISVMLLRTLKEEAMMKDHFGENYVKYCAKLYLKRTVEGKCT